MAHDVSARRSSSLCEDVLIESFDVNGGRSRILSTGRKNVGNKTQPEPWPFQTPKQSSSAQKRENGNDRAAM